MISKREYIVFSILVLVILFTVLSANNQQSNFTDIEISGTLTVNGGIKFLNNVVCGKDSFEASAVRKSIYIPGASADDLYFITGIGELGTALTSRYQTEAKQDSLIVYRVPEGVVGSYNWLRVKVKE